MSRRTSSLRTASRSFRGRTALIALCLIGFPFAGRIGAEAGSPPERVSAREAEAREFLDGRLPVWQSRLRLDGWRLEYQLTRRSALKPRTLGNVHWDLGRRTATIRVLHPDDYGGVFRRALEDMELTLVHEMVHIHLAVLPRSEATKATEEQVVTSLSEALVALDRSRGEVPVVAAEQGGARRVGDGAAGPGRASRMGENQ